jgi:D-amino peptidase
VTALRLFVVAACAGVCLSSAAGAQSRGLKVLLLYDMEGISAADEYRKTTVAHPEQYAQGRRSLTDDVNGAIAGLAAGGATEIVVVDGHGSGNNDSPDVIVDEIRKPGAMHFRATAFDIYMDSYDHSIDAIVAIGMHAGAGNRTGFLAHTYSAHDIEYRVNGVPFNETMILAMGAARLRIPVIMVSGDDQLERELSPKPAVGEIRGRQARRQRQEGRPAAARRGVAAHRSGGPGRAAVARADEGDGVSGPVSVRREVRRAVAGPERGALARLRAQRRRADCRFGPTTLRTATAQACGSWVWPGRPGAPPVGRRRFASCRTQPRSGRA